MDLKLTADIMTKSEPRSFIDWEYAKKSKMDFFSSKYYFGNNNSQNQSISLQLCQLLTLNKTLSENEYFDTDKVVGCKLPSLS